jgi:hypothetical protein
MKKNNQDKNGMVTTDLCRANQMYDSRPKEKFVPFTGKRGNKINKKFVKLQIRMTKRYAKRKHKLRECKGKVHMYKFGSTIDGDGKF